MEGGKLHLEPENQVGDGVSPHINLISIGCVTSAETNALAVSSDRNLGMTEQSLWRPGAGGLEFTTSTGVLVCDQIIASRVN